MEKMCHATVKVSGLSKQFKENVALNHLDFNIQPGEIFGFLGPSGSGKTTTINILTNQLSADAGEVTILGKKSHELVASDRSYIGIVSDNNGFYEKLSLYKNLQIYAKIHQQKMSYVDQLLRDVDLYESRNTIAEKLSNGMKQRMFLVRALINKPRLLFLDEPTSGLDPHTRLKIHRLVMKLKESGVSIFLTTHDMEEATKLCDRLVLLYQGKIIEQGSPSEIINRHNVNQSVEITFKDKERKKVISLSQLFYQEMNLENVFSIHTLEPTLADIFIKMTGASLSNEN